MHAVLDTLNMAQRDQALSVLSPLVERSPWVAEAVVDQRPFASDAAIAEALVEVILAASPGQREALFNAHPELSGIEATEGRMTAESTSEQGRLGLNRLPSNQAERLRSMNDVYKRRFGHPFIIALHRVPDLATLFATYERRLEATPLEEHITTLAEIASVIRSRCYKAFVAASETTSTLHFETQETPQ